MKKGSQLEIGRLLLNNKPLNVNLSSAITEVTLSQTIEGASTLTLNLNDYKRNLVNSDFSRTATRLKLDDLTYRLTNIDKSGDGLTLTFEEEAVYVLRHGQRRQQVAQAQAQGRDAGRVRAPARARTGSPEAEGKKLPRGRASW